MEASLYVHVPFCAGGKCDYCDFYSVPIKPSGLYSADSRPGRFVETVLLEAERLFETCSPSVIPTLYIGGGTPSVLGSEGIRKLLDGLSERISRFSPPPVEITVEANPESADEAFLAACREGGATRLSLGIQTLYGPSREAVHRVGSGHRPTEQGSSEQGSAELCSEEKLLRRRLALAAEYFPSAFSVDLMSGLPFQNERILLDDIDAILSHRPAHVSLYALTVEKGTPLAANAAAAATALEAKSTHDKPFLPSRDEADQLWLCGRDALEKSGYGQYEVSNFCLAGQESRHNIRYWLMKNWLALGPSASGTIINDETGTGLRYTNPKDADAWLAGKTKETLDRLTLVKETLLMGFRYIKGPDEDLFRRRFHSSIGELVPKTLSAWQSRGFLQKDRIALTKEGLLFLDPFLLDSFQELDVSFFAC